jgi:hypothetical protein
LTGKKKKEKMINYSPSALPSPFFYTKLICETEEANKKMASAFEELGLMPELTRAVEEMGWRFMSFFFFLLL